MKKCPFIVTKGFIDCIGWECELWGVNACGLKYIPPKFEGAYQGEYIVEIAQKFADMIGEHLSKKDVLKCYEEVKEVTNDRQGNKGTSKESGKARTGKRQVKRNRS